VRLNSFTYRSPRTEKTAEEWDKKVEYDLDSEDEEFLATYNNENKKPLSDDLCERLIDALEKEYFKQVGILNIHYTIPLSSIAHLIPTETRKGSQF